MKISHPLLIVPTLIALAASAFSWWQHLQLRAFRQSLKLLADANYGQITLSKTYLDNLALAGDEPTRILDDRKSLIARWNAELLSEARLLVATELFTGESGAALLAYLKRPAGDILPGEMMAPREKRTPVLMDGIGKEKAVEKWRFAD